MNKIHLHFYKSQHRITVYCLVSSIYEFVQFSGYKDSVTNQYFVKTYMSANSLPKYRSVITYEIVVQLNEMKYFTFGSISAQI